MATTWNYAEVWEAVADTQPEALDAVVIGVPDRRSGEMVVAVVQQAAEARASEEELIAHVKGRLAGFKAPRRVRVVPTLGRAPNGKLDYRRHKEETAEWIASNSEASTH